MMQTLGVLTLIAGFFGRTNRPGVNRSTWQGLRNRANKYSTFFSWSAHTSEELRGLFVFQIKNVCYNYNRRREA